MKLALVIALGASATAAADPYIHVGRCPNGGYMVDFNCPEFLATPGLPAVDATGRQVIVGFRDEFGLSTLPNLAVWILSTVDGRKVDAIPVWSQDEGIAFAKKMEGKPDQDVRPVIRAVEAKRAKVEPQLAGYKPIPHCTRVPPEHDPDDIRMMVCGGADHWKCGDLDVRYGRSHATLALHSEGTTTTIDTRGWRHPPLDIKGGDTPMKVDTLNCIIDAARIPNTSKVVIELEHVCDASGDWCYVGGHTFQIVSK